MTYRQDSEFSHKENIQRGGPLNLGEVPKKSVVTRVGEKVVRRQRPGEVSVQPEAIEKTEREKLRGFKKGLEKSLKASSKINERGLPQVTDTISARRNAENAFRQ